MVMLLVGVERAAAAFERLFARSGWHPRRIVPHGAPPEGVAVLEASLTRP
jgi:hypothetical protein